MNLIFAKICMIIGSKENVISGNSPGLTGKSCSYIHTLRSQVKGRKEDLNGGV